jgi:chromosomal replication initiator protein
LDCNPFAGNGSNSSIADVSTSWRQLDQRAFLVLPENELAVTAVKKLAPNLRRRNVRLVTVVGPAGVGKSHLARELVRGWESERGDGKIIVTSGSQFSAQFAEASESSAISQFQTRHRNDVSLLVCEDVQILGPRKETQQQLLAAIDDVISRGGVVLLTSNQMPGSIRGFARRLVNRMHGGVCVSMELPGLESRRKLIRQMTTALGQHLSPAEIELVATEHAVSPRSLLGLLAQFHAETNILVGRRSGKTPHLQSILSDRRQGTGVAIEEIARATASQFHVKPADLKGPRRSQTISLARQTAMYLAREIAGMNYVEIGKYFNRANHSTVIHACRKIASQRGSNPGLDREIQTIQEAIRVHGGS